jgi:hypothetical protein
LLPQEELRSVRVSVARLNPDGKGETPLVMDQLLSQGPYPRDTPVRVTLPQVTTPGLYHVLVNGERLRSGTNGLPPAVVDVWVLHAPAPAQ